jgi:site-specific recombinase XerD
MTRSGMEGISAAAEALRHTAATQMVCRGASFKDVADVLGHASLATTAICTKLDVATLLQVALPWPGARS